MIVMSCIFIVAMTEVPSDSNLEYWLERGTYLAEADWRRLSEACCSLVPDPDDYDSEQEWVDACGLMFRAVFTDVFRWAGSRTPADATVVGIEGKLYFVSGGFTYGDPPTDSYDTISAFDTLRDYLIEFGIADPNNIITEQEDSPFDERCDDCEVVVPDGEGNYPDGDEGRRVCADCAKENN